MTIASDRAQAVAEILWELKKKNKVATFSVIAEHAGFSAGSSGRTMHTCMKAIRKDWPQLQWWRAVTDDGVVDAEQKTELVQEGYPVEDGDGDESVVKLESDQWMNWNEPEEEADTADSTADESA